jgi:hypothetical protein
MSPVHLWPDLPAYVDLIVLRGTNGELDMFARNADGVHVPVAALDPRNGWQQGQADAA